MKIEPNKLYKTRSSQKARIYAVEETAGGLIHGAVWCASGWSSIEWSTSGRQFNFDNDNDLISEWTDPPQKKKLYAYLKISGTCFYILGYFDKEDAANGLRCPSLDLEVEV